MSLKIRLARAGTKKRPVYHIVVADSRAPRDGRFIERLGYFNPLLPKDNTERLKLDLEKAKAWIAKGAQPTDRVLRFLDDAGVLKRETRNNPEKAKPKKKAQERAAAALPLLRSAAPKRGSAAASCHVAERVCIAQIGAAHGMRGEVRLKPFTRTRSAVTRYGALESRGRNAALRDRGGAAGQGHAGRAAQGRRRIATPPKR